ncbi:MAG: extracellular solute-binding protein [Clostridiales bacterium]|nr:extracellular solute-binding protein [Clostridiales bacterium]
MKREIRILALALAAMLILVACSSAQDPAPAASASSDLQSQAPQAQASESQALDAEPEPFTMYWWGGVPYEMGPQQVIEAYTKIHPNITFEYVKLGWDDASNIKLDTALMSGEGIDVYMPTRGYLEKAEKGLAMELTAFIERDGVDLIADIGEDMTTYMFNDKYYNIPTSRSPCIYFINMDKLEAAGLEMPDSSWTTDDLLNLSKALSSGEGASRSYGAFFTYNWGNMWLQPSAGFLSQFEMFSNDVSEMILDPRLKESAEIFAQMQDIDKSTPSYAECAAENYDPAQMILTEKAAMVYSGTYLLRDIKNLEAYPHEFKTGFALPPLSLKYPEKEYAVSSLEDPIMISPRTAHVEESWEFVKWFYKEGFDGFIKYGRVPSYVGYTAEMVSDLLVSGYENILDKDSFIEVYNSARPLSSSLQGVEVSIAMTALNQQVELAMLGSQSIDEALEKGLSEGGKALKE